MAPVQRMTTAQLREAMDRSDLPELLLRRPSLVLDDSTDTEFVADVLPVDDLRRIWAGRLARSHRPPDGLQGSLRMLDEVVDSPEARLVVVDGLGLQAHVAVCGSVLKGCVVGDLADRRLTT